MKKILESVHQLEWIHAGRNVLCLQRGLCNGEKSILIVHIQVSFTLVNECVQNEKTLSRRAFLDMEAQVAIIVVTWLLYYL